MKSRSTPEYPAWWDPKNARAMLISRISDKKQSDGVSLEAQRHHQQEYARAAGLVVVATEAFQESAKTSKLRVQFHAAIAKARREGIRHIVFYVFDRISRNFTDLETLEEFIRGGDIVVHVAQGGNVLHKYSDDGAFFMADINIAQAKQDNRARRTKTIDGMTQRCRNGWHPSRVPFGYTHQPVLDANGRPKRRGSTVAGPSPEAVRLLRREKDLRMKHYSLDRIRETCLAEQLVPTALIPQYRRSSIEKRLKNVFYAALPQPHDGYVSRFEWRGELYEGKHDPVFTAEEWDALAATFGQRTAFKKRKHDGLFAQGALTLTCATPSCGCKITYAPKKKPSGLTFHYYRCADGKRVHRERGEPQVNVREASILEQLAGAVEAISLTQKIACSIAFALNETHRAATAAKREAVKVYKAQLASLDDKENRIVDLFAAGSFEPDVFRRQQARVREDRHSLFEKLQAAESEADDAYLVTADRVLELAKDAKTLWEGRAPAEQRDFLALLVCNPVLDGRTVRYTLRKPFAVLAQMHGEGGWRPRRDSNPC
jgi:DNA invertase Pin-like site-specific DNA recombinase